MSLSIPPGSVDQSVYIHMADATTGTDKTDLTAAGMTAAYQRDNGALVAVTLSALASLTATHSDGGAIHASGGVYRIDLPDAAFASGASTLRLYLSATGAVQTAGAAVIRLDAAVSSRLAAEDYTTPPAASAVAAEVERTGGMLAGVAEDLAAIPGTSGEEGVYTVYKPGGTVPLAGASVYVSSDAEGLVRSETKISDALGRVRFRLLLPGTYYWWRSHPSYTFTNPDTETIEAA